MDEKFLKSLDLPEDSIPKILAEHTKELEAKAAQLQAEGEKLKTANQTIKDLQEAAKAFDGVDVQKLQGDMTALQEKYDQDIAALKLDNALELALVSGQVRNTKAVKALLDSSQIKLDGDTLTGLDSQLKALRETDGYLFKDSQIPNVVRPTGNPPADEVNLNQMTYSQTMAYLQAHPNAKV